LATHGDFQDSIEVDFSTSAWTRSKASEKYADDCNEYRIGLTSPLNPLAYIGQHAIVLDQTPLADLRRLGAGRHTVAQQELLGHCGWKSDAENDGGVET
jgi:hypothetical protein